MPLQSIYSAEFSGGTNAIVRAARWNPSGIAPYYTSPYLPVGTDGGIKFVSCQIEGNGTPADPHENRVLLDPNHAYPGRGWLQQPMYLASASQTSGVVPLADLRDGRVSLVFRARTLVLPQTSHLWFYIQGYDPSLDSGNGRIAVVSHVRDALHGKLGFGYYQRQLGTGVFGPITTTGWVTADIDLTVDEIAWLPNGYHSDGALFDNSTRYASQPNPEPLLEGSRFGKLLNIGMIIVYDNTENTPIVWGTDSPNDIFKDPYGLTADGVTVNKPPATVASGYIDLQSIEIFKRV